MSKVKISGSPKKYKNSQDVGLVLVSLFTVDALII